MPAYQTEEKKKHTHNPIAKLAKVKENMTQENE
jgi:hypothetical protein